MSFCERCGADLAHPARHAEWHAELDLTLATLTKRILLIEVDDLDRRVKALEQQVEDELENDADEIVVLITDGDTGDTVHPDAPEWGGPDWIDERSY